MANYSARLDKLEDIQIVRLSDSAGKTEAAIAVSVGNMAYEWKVDGRNLLWFPFDDPAALRKAPTLCGIPLLAPWANRLDEDAFWMNGRRYVLNAALGNLRRDGHGKPIHGLVNFSPKWELVESGADEGSAWSRSRLAFFRHPEMMAQFPFAHTLTMTHRLRSGTLEVETNIENHSAGDMPVAIGFHPYFQPLGTRDDWQIHLPVSEHWKLSELSLPTGEFEKIQGLDAGLRERQFDDVYSGLTRGSDGFAPCWVEGGGHRLTVSFGPKYSTAVVYAPAGREFICFEPMAAITNGMNLAHAGKYASLQSIPAGQSWDETFRLQLT